MHDDENGETGTGAERASSAAGAHSVAATASGAREPAVSSWHVMLLLATLVTTTWAGAMHQGIDIAREPSRWPAGVPYALAILGILGVHELGHYVVARRRGVDVTLPYFIPAPFYLGTFGAFIRMREVTRNRADAFDIAIAGPLAGLAAALLALLIGLRGEATAVHGGITPSSSLLLGATYAFVTGATPDAAVQLGALAFAGWIGFFVTALNLVPVGQLDGGHIAYALLGQRRAAALALAVILTMVAAGLFLGGHWIMWAFIAWAVGGVRHPASADEGQALGPGRTALGMGCLVLLLAIVLPWPG